MIQTLSMKTVDELREDNASSSENCKKNMSSPRNRRGDRSHRKRKPG